MIHSAILGLRVRVGPRINEDNEADANDMFCQTFARLRSLELSRILAIAKALEGHSLILPLQVLINHLQHLPQNDHIYLHAGQNASNLPGNGQRHNSR